MFGWPGLLAQLYVEVYVVSIGSACSLARAIYSRSIYNSDLNASARSFSDAAGGPDIWPSLTEVFDCVYVQRAR